jgi:hypothetical protein
MVGMDRYRGAPMADLIIVYWRDIPAQVIVKKGRASAKRELPAALHRGHRHVRHACRRA